MKLTFIFFEDVNGRLRARIRELGKTKPVETVDKSKKYNIVKIFGLWNWTISQKDLLKLQTAQNGDVIEVDATKGFAGYIS